MIRTVRWPPRARILVLATGSTVLACALAGPASAQSFATPSEGLYVGRFRFFPSITLDYTHDNNVFYGSPDLDADERIASGVWVVRPRLMVDLPMGESRIQWSYSPLYRDYTSARFAQSDRVSHYFDLDGILKLGRLLRIGLRDHLVQGTVELREVDRGGELTFGLTPFTLHEPQLRVDLDLAGRHGFSILPGWSAAEFGEEGAAFSSYRKKQLETRYNYRMDLTTTAYAYYTTGSIDQDRERILFDEVGIRTRSLGLGLRRAVDETVVSQFSIGRESMEFDHALGEDFAGLVVNMDTTWLLSAASRLEAAVGRQPYQSFFINNTHYVNTHIRIGLRQQVGRNTYWDLTGSYEANDYDEPLDISVTPETPPDLDADADGQIDLYESYLPSLGIQRLDRAYRLEVGAGYRFLQTLRAFVGYNVSRRDSNIEQQISGEVIDPFSYRVNRLVFRIEVGWL